MNIWGSRINGSTVIGLMDGGFENVSGYGNDARVLELLKDTPSRQCTIRELALTLELTESETLNIVNTLISQHKVRTMG